MRRLAVVSLVVVLLPSEAAGQVRVSDSCRYDEEHDCGCADGVDGDDPDEQHSQLRRIGQRLSMFTNLGKYGVRDVPRWRIHDFENPEAFLFARAYHAAMNYGDPTGAAYLAVSHPVNASPLLGRLRPDVRRDIAARLATLEVADAAAIASTHDSGRIRFNGRREQVAIDALEADVTDPSLEQSATAVLDKDQWRDPHWRSSTPSPDRVARRCG